MQWIPEYRDDVPRVERFNALARVTHWSHTVTFLLCLFTGLALFLRADWLAAIFGGFRGAGLVHRIAAVVMTVTILTAMVVGIKGVIAWIKDLLRFGLNDIGFLMKFPLEFLGFKVKIPPQTRFNGGEKLNRYPNLGLPVDDQRLDHLVAFHLVAGAGKSLLLDS